MTNQASQADINTEMHAIAAEARSTVEEGGSPELQPRRNYPPYRSSLLRHPTHELVRVDPEEVERLSPAFGHTDVNVLESDLTIQHTGEPLGERITAGLFYGFALPYEGGPGLVPGHHPNAIRLHGTVFDGDGEPVPDAILEIWQADEAGVISRELGSHDRDGFTFTGFGRAAVNLAGHYTFTTVKPGAVSDGAPSVLVTVFARGLLHHLFTRAYFPEDAEAHRTDRVLSAVPEGRRDTLVSSQDGPASYRFDIRLQGEGETVFLDFDA